MAQGLRAWAVLLEDPGTILNTSMASPQPPASPVPEDPMPFFDFCGLLNTHCAFAYTYVYVGTHIHNIIITEMFDY